MTLSEKSLVLAHVVLVNTSGRVNSLDAEWLSHLALRIMGIALPLARQCQDNRLVKYWLKIVQETLICDMLMQ